MAAGYARGILMPKRRKPNLCLSCGKIIFNKCKNAKFCKLCAYKRKTGVDINADKTRYSEWELPKYERSIR